MHTWYCTETILHLVGETIMVYFEFVGDIACAETLSCYLHLDVDLLDSSVCTARPAKVRLVPQACKSARRDKCCACPGVLQYPLSECVLISSGARDADFAGKPLIFKGSASTLADVLVALTFCLILILSVYVSLLDDQDIQPRGIFQMQSASQNLDMSARTLDLHRRSPE